MDKPQIKKLDLINSEIEIQKNQNFTEFPKKYFATFPYTYQNGNLHLGHAYSLTKLEFKMRFMMLKGYNILFPIAYHCSGMPIVASALRLKEALEKCDINIVDMDSLPFDNQIKMLYGMDIPREEIIKFVDPQYWLSYFPKRNEKDLKKLGICADFTRSFITTNANPYYDSFIKWQFSVLHKKGYIKFGERPMIYSPKDKQVCGDHDRSKGEGINPIKLYCYLMKLNEQTILVTNKYPVVNVESVVFNPIDSFVEFEYKDIKVIASNTVFRNLSYQKEIKYVRTIDKLNIASPNVKETDKNVNGFVFVNSNNGISLNHDFEYYEPKELVVSRTGDICVVNIIEQWYIDYDVKEVKDRVINYVKNNLIIKDESVKNMFVEAANWLKEWSCSRSFGLGTQLLDTEFIIDSLSDSTIYMAYYTIANKINNVPIEYIDNNFWEYLFGDNKVITIPDIYKKIVMDMKSEFKYWYPVDLRVSAKDLVYNHLTMSLYNHLMVWDDEAMLPKEYYVNGYIMLNGSKMSKSEGNFMTLSHAIDKYGSDVIRVVLASSGNGMNDANFMENECNGWILKLYSEKIWCMKAIDILTKQDKKQNILDKSFVDKLKECMLKVECHYDKMEYQKALAEGFHKIIKLKKRYIDLDNINFKSLFEYLRIFLLTIYPICPHFTESIWNYGQQQNILFPKEW